MKQIIVMRRTFNGKRVRTGKMIAQGAHASMAAILQRNPSGPSALKDDPRIVEWLSTAFTKITVYVDSEEELLALYEKAKAAGLITALIQDAGRTEFKGVKTYTAVAVGPDTNENLAPITGQLPLL